MANRLLSRGLTADTILVLPCNTDLVLGLRELWRDVKRDDHKTLFSNARLLAIAESPVETWGEFCGAISAFDGIVGRVFRRDRHYLNTTEYSHGRALRCQWFAGETLDQVIDQALRWGDDMTQKELSLLNDHAALSAALVGAHND